MKTAIYYYTGTGNSLWTARRIAGELGNTELVPMIAAGTAKANIAADNVGLVFPVHMWGLPLRVISFVRQMTDGAGKYHFAVAVNAGQVAATLIQLKELFDQKGIILSSGFSVCMPSNYIPWGGAPPEDKQRQLFLGAEEKIIKLAEVVKKRESRKPEKGPVWQNFFLSILYRMASPKIPGMDKAFSADERCTSCTICEKICPSKNIILVDGKPKWQNSCEQCLACIQWCPPEAIQFGKGTKTKKRYHHPDIKIADMIAAKLGNQENRHH
jgi:ferredoxin